MIHKEKNQYKSICCIGLDASHESKFNSYFSQNGYKIDFSPRDNKINFDLINSFDVCFIYINEDFTIKDLLELYNKEVICLMSRNEKCALILISNNSIYCLQPYTDCKDIDLFIKNILSTTISDVDCENAWVLDIEKEELLKQDNKRIPLTKTEVVVLTSMLMSEENYINRDELISKLKLNYNTKYDLVLNTTICRLRKKLADYDSTITIKTWRTNGYSIEGSNIIIKKPKDKCPHC